jgi:hypothetical protein
MSDNNNKTEAAQFFTASEFGLLTKKKTSTIYAACAKKLIPHVKIAGSLRIPRAALKQFEEQALSIKPARK